MNVWHQLSRRRLARVAARAGSALAGLGLLGAIDSDPADAGAARPATAAPGTTLRLAVDWEGLSVAASQAPAFIGEVLRHFEAAHRGLRVEVALGPCSNGPNNTCADCNMASTLAGLMAGDGPDVFSVCGSTTGLVDGGLVAPITPYLERDNVPESTWPSQTLVRYRQGGQLFFLPSEEQPVVMVFNRGLLNQLGIAVPSPDWSYTEAADIWRAASAEVNKQRRYGVAGDNMAPGSNSGWAWITGGFGGSTHTAQGTRATFNNPACISAGTWLQGLQRDQVATGCDLYGCAQSFVSGQVVFMDAPSWSVPVAATALRGMDWAFQPYPVFPKGRSCWLGGNPYALSAASREPDAAWELLKWLCVEPDYWRYEVRVTLNTPSQTALWPEWSAAVLQVAPDLKGKGLHWYADAMVNDYARWGSPFAYDGPQVDNIIGQWSGEMWSGKVSAAAAFAAIDRQVDALEEAAAAAAPHGAAAGGGGAAMRQLQYVAAEPATRTFAAPPLSGAGLAAKPASAAVRVKGQGITLQGGGQGMLGNADDGTFACAAIVPARGTFICRLAAFGPTGGPLDAAASAGLMFRSALGDASPMGALLVSQQQGVVLAYRQAPYFSMNTDTPSKGSAPTGLIGDEVLMYPLKPARANYLRRPVWLKVVRDVGVWSLSTSLDGVKWHPVASPLDLDIAGAWIGLFATAQQSGGGKGLVAATFDHISGFTPRTFVALGAGR